MMTFATYQCSNIYEHANCLAGWDQKFDQIESGEYAGQLADLTMPGIRLFRESGNRTVVQNLHFPEGQRHILLPLSWPRGHDGMEVAGIYALPLQPTCRITVPAGYDILCLSLPIRQAQSLPDTSHPSPLPISPSVLKLVKRQWIAMIKCIEAKGEPRSEAGKRAIRRRLRDGRDLLLEATKEQALDNRSYCSRRYIVQKCDEMIRQNLDQPPTLMELCRKLRICRRTLQYSFETETGASPLYYLRAVRLNAARRAIAHSPDACLADLAAQQGFLHESYFTRIYKDLFNELPSQTRKRNLMQQS